MRAAACLTLLGLCGTMPLLCQPAAEEPVGLVITTQSAKLVRGETLVPFTAKTGDILFQGDSLIAAGGTVSFLYCPEKSSQTLSPDATVVLGSKSLRIKSGRVTTKTNVSGSCWLPKLVRVSIASQQQYGFSFTRPLQAPGAETFAQRMQALPEAQRAALAAELAPVDAKLAANPGDTAARIARAVLLENNNLRVDAAAEYRRALQQWPDAVWIFSRLFALEDQPKADEPVTPSGGKTYALIVGVSKYKSDRINPLLYAAQDAALFRDFLKSPRGGALPDSDIVLLTDEQATTPKIRVSIIEFLKAKATKNDTVILFIAAHGTVQPADRQAFIVTHEADPENLAGTALAMADLQVLFQQQLSGVRRAILYLDTCHAGQLGEVGIKPINDAVEPLTKAGGELFSFLASGKGEKSEEGPQFGGGHGAFSYFVVDALNGSADQDQNNQVDFNEFVDFVRDMVKKSTSRRQNPKDLGDLGKTIMSEVGKPGLTLARWTPGGVQLALATPPMTRSLEQRDPRLREFEEALAAARILRDAPQNAFDALSRLRSTLGPAQYLEQENKLRAALEDRGRETLLRYLKGEQVPQNRADFLAGAAYFTAAQSLSPESVLLESEKVFCLGRAALFEPKDYNGAASLLERAARLDPTSAYSFNALGIAYLERAEYTQAVLAFRDAIRRAPYWAYPRHNLALAYTQTGAYAAAIETYRAAMRLAPRYSYLPYNLGLLYQRLNRNREAEVAYRQAIALSPDLAEPYNALGYLNADLGRSGEAERLYRQALSKNADLLSARQNLAALLAQDPKRAEDALALWRENLAKDEGYLPSRLSLARGLARLGRDSEAMQQYTSILARKPDYVAARLALAELKAKAGDSAGALADLEEAAKTQPGSAQIYEQIGDLEKARGNTAQATKAYETALRNTRDRSATKRLRAK